MSFNNYCRRFAVWVPCNEVAKGDLEEDGGKMCGAGKGCWVQKLPFTGIQLNVKWKLGLLLPLILILFFFLMPELTSIFTLSFLTLWDSLPLSVFSTYQWQTLSNEDVQDASNVNWTSTPCFYFSYCPPYRVWRQTGFFLTYFCYLLANTFLM